MEAARDVDGGDTKAPEGDLKMSNPNPLNLDSFDGYSSLAERWDTITGTPGVGGPGRTGAQCASFAPGQAVGKNIPAISAFYCGFALYMPTLPNGKMQVFGTYDGTTWQLGLRIDPSGFLILGTGESAGEFANVLATSTLALTAGVWHYIEIKGVISPTVGVAEVKVDGTTVYATASGVNTSPSGSAQITSYWIGQQEQGWTTNKIDDHYFLDANGTAPNGYQGNCQVVWVQPSAAGSNAQFTPQGNAANWQNVDDNPADGDTTYNKSITPGQIDSFLKPGLASNIASVPGVLLVARVRADNGAPVIHLVAKSGAALAESADIALGLSYKTVTAPISTDPATTAAWTPAGFNAAEIGYKDISN